MDYKYRIIDSNLNQLLKIIYRHSIILYIFKSESFVDLLRYENARDNILDFLQLILYPDYNKDEILPTFYTVDNACKFLKELYDNNININLSFSTLGGGDLRLHCSNDLRVVFGATIEKNSYIYRSIIVNNKLESSVCVDISFDNFVNEAKACGII